MSSSFRTSTDSPLSLPLNDISACDFSNSEVIDDASSSCDSTERNMKENTGRWTDEEHRLFLEGLKLHGKGWKKIASLIKTRTVVQIRTHAQKYFQKLAKAKQNGFDGEILMDGRSTFTASSKKKGSKRKAKFLRASSVESSSVHEQDTYDAEDDDEGYSPEVDPPLSIDAHAAEAVAKLGTPSPTSVAELSLPVLTTPVEAPVPVPPSTAPSTWYDNQAESNQDVLLESDTLSWLADDDLADESIPVALDSDGHTDGSTETGSHVSVGGGHFDSRQAFAFHPAPHSDHVEEHVKVELEGAVEYSDMADEHMAKRKRLSVGYPPCHGYSHSHERYVGYSTELPLEAPMVMQASMRPRSRQKTSISVGYAQQSSGEFNEAHHNDSDGFSVPLDVDAFVSGFLDVLA